MKKIALVLGIFVSSIPFFANAQRINLAPQDRFTVGIKGGINWSNVWDEQGQHFQASSKAGFAGGAFFGIPVIRYFGVQPELLVSQKGYQSTGTYLGSSYKHTRAPLPTWMCHCSLPSNPVLSSAYLQAPNTLTWYTRKMKQIMELPA